MKKNSICKIIVSGLLTAVPLMGMAQQVCGNKPWSGTDGNSSAYPYPTEFRYESFVLSNPTRAWWSNFSPKWYLAAFPASEVNKGYGLTQNPGW